MRTDLTRRATILSALGLVSTAAHASVAEPFGVGYTDPKHLARVMRKSQITDPEGKLPVNSDRCLPNGYSCASARQYLEGFQKADPDANLRSVGQLPDYLDTLVPGYPQGEYWMAGIRKYTRGKIWDWDSLSRKLETGERAWKNPKTGKFVLAGKCTNPMGLLVEPNKCVEVHYYLERNDEIHIGLLGPDALPRSTCLAILKAGETEWSNVIRDECPRAGCDYSGPARALGNLTVQPALRVSYKAEKSGWHKLRLPRFMLQTEDVLIFCVIKPDRTQSRGMIIAKRHYYQGIAYLGYAPGDSKLRGTHPKLTVPKGAFMHPWLWASSLAPAR